jgi:hypothetical protein
MTLANIFAIDNLDQITINCRKYAVRGLIPDSESYEKNVQLLSDLATKLTKSPCPVQKEDGQLFLVQPVGSAEIPDRVSLVGTEAIIEQTTGEQLIDFGHLTDQTFSLATRFLHFSLNGLFYEIPTLWQPSAGQPFFQKSSDYSAGSNTLGMYRGFRTRLIELAEHKIGLCVDITRKYASLMYLPFKITPDEFRPFKGRKCIYEFGNRWYEIRISSISGLNASEVMIEGLPLYDYVNSKCSGPKPKVLLSLPKDCAVLTYQTSLGVTMNVPSGLCRLTYATEHPDVRELHYKSILAPNTRRHEIETVVQSYLSNWRLANIQIKLSDRMLTFESTPFDPPDLRFGGGKTLSLRHGNDVVSLDNLGHGKKRMLYSTDAGLFIRKPLDRQYLIVPRSMRNSFGQRFLEDLKAQFARFSSPKEEFQYDPVVIAYDDSVRQSVYSLGNEILHSVSTFIRNSFLYQGYGLVIIPRLDHRSRTKEDELGNLLMSELRKMGIHVSISHTEIPRGAYVQVILNSGQTGWELASDQRLARRFRGYMENLTLNKLLLLNNCWPFVLGKPLNSDLIVGVDVKNNTAGLMITSKDGAHFRFVSSDSDQKEQLSRGHLSTKLYHTLSEELEDSSKVKDITIHRDGKLFAGEVVGIKDALRKLADNGILDRDFNCNMVEIRKTSRIPVRFFDTSSPLGSQQETSFNPIIGTYKIFGSTAFLCTTGRPFTYQGTSKPLQIVKIEGRLAFRLILEDVFALTNLTWTKPDSCLRVPITMKMMDIRLREWGGDYDEDQLKFEEED